MGTELLGRGGIKEIVAEADTSDGMGWSPSRLRRKEGEAPDQWTRAVSGRRGLARGMAGRPAGPAKLGCASWAGSRAKPSGPQRERNKAGRRGEEKATAVAAGLRAEKKEE